MVAMRPPETLLTTNKITWGHSSKTTVHISPPWKPHIADAEVYVHSSGDQLAEDLEPVQGANAICSPHWQAQGRPNSEQTSRFI